MGNQRKKVKRQHSHRGARLFHHEGHEEHLGGVVAGPVYCTPEVALKLTRSPGLGAASILCVLRALGGEFCSTCGLASQPASVPCKPEPEITTHSKRHGIRKSVAAIPPLLVPPFVSLRCRSQSRLVSSWAHGAEQDRHWSAKDACNLLPVRFRGEDHAA